MNLRRRNLIFIFISILLPILYGIFFIRNFSMPLSGGGDIDEWEYVGFFLSENLKFTPFPTLTFQQNNTFYPFGTTQAFSDWSLESNYWFAFFYKNWGHGAWLNFYYVVSLIISFLGSYIILKSDFGEKKAFFAGFVVTFFNFYALNKYPHHFNHSTIHWLILSVFSDFIIVKRLILKEPMSVKWVFLKAFLLIAVLGMNLGYICGFALNSFVLCFIVVAFVLMKRYFNKDFQLIDTFKIWWQELRNRPFFYIFLALPFIIYAFLFLPLVFQIYFEAKSSHLDSANAPHFWSNPVRMLLPFSPLFDNINPPFADILKDMPEGLGSGSPGWFCLLLGIVGFYYNRKKYWLVFLPFIVLILISTFYHPIRIPTLKIFPWGAYNRVPSRFTSLLPVLFCCFFLPLNLQKIKYRKLFLGLLITFLIVEGAVIYQFRYRLKPFSFNKDFFTYMKHIEKQEGEAVMDFPFCVVGGDGTGLKENICPVFQKTCNVYALRRFHHKKVIGGYYSHVPDDAVNGFVEIGVGNWLTADTDSWRTASKITNTFNDKQLEHFIKYFQYNDFVGINVCIDLIPPKMYQQLIEAIGKPTESTIFPGAGRVVFIPRPQDWKNLVNKEKAKNIHYPCGCS